MATRTIKAGNLVIGDFLLADVQHGGGNVETIIHTGALGTVALLDVTVTRIKGDGWVHETVSLFADNLVRVER